MQLLAYCLAYPLLWFVSKLPFPVFYALSDLIYFLVYRVFGYRKATVRKNLALALPHKSEAERRVIEKEFFKHMCDMFMEMVKSMSISDEEMKRRFIFTNLELATEYEKRGKSIILMCAHYASWEWLMVMSNYITFESYAIYKKIGNRYFDSLVQKIRGRHNAKLIESKSSIGTMELHKKNGVKAFYGFASDQSPQLTKAKYWDTFMGIEVPVYTGAEMLAKRLDMNMLFVKVEKVKRGFYQATLVPLVEEPKKMPDYEITGMYLREVEKQILQKPEHYFWTHKRWKHIGKKRISSKKSTSTQF
ncbi:lysophospholipid acyltransferase family protein [Flavobacterium aurantiibacter]|uniref:Lipid A biosynthesis acyltransferase n=1 Tax=Flavobacterium aurantiibacter TaxID=2023067 RepID=A0A256A8J0_9FLAO|nr:lysophospholipid acyltransferase family protein [Flavobacterium aurantiibacter]OYQ50016.1 lipid A biosynthesis acyltransferase [Flavobacterium aurantiibacter]